MRLESGDWALDLGGSIGTTAMLFSRSVGPTGRIYVFEPITHTVLGKNLRENRVPNVRVIPKGVADQPGMQKFMVSDNCIDSSFARPVGTDGHPPIDRMVEVTTIDQFVEQEGLERLDFIKMDIEGAEELALRGAARVINRFRPKWSIASYHTDHTGEKQHPKLLRLLGEFGYNVKEVHDHGSRIYAW